MSSPVNREPVVDALAEVWNSIRAACDGLSASQWEEPTDCPGWTVRDHLSHVVGIERMLLGDPAPPPLTSFPEHVRNPLGEINEAWVESRRATPGLDVLREFRETSDRRLEELRSLPAEHFDVVARSPLGEMPYRRFMQTRVIDSWAHEQDIRRAVGRPGGRNGAGEATLLVGCADNMAVIMGKLAPPDGTVVSFVISGLMGRQLAVRMETGRGSFVERDEDGEPPTTTLTMDQEAFWRLCCGRVEPVRLLGTGQVRVEGDVVVGHQVLDAMAFIT